MYCAKQAILLLCHYISPAILREFYSIRRAIRSQGDAWLLYHKRRKFLPVLVKIHRHFSFSYKSLNTLHYRMMGEKLVPGNAHFPLLQFYREFPGYHYYWLIEHDVRFSGDWRLFFDEFKECDADFLTCHIRTYENAPNWDWWELDHPENHIKRSDMLASFNPIYRICNHSLSFLHQKLIEGWKGHNEVLFPTLLRRHGFKILDIGGQGIYTPQHWKDKFYTAETLKYRPVFKRPGNMKNLLYHPVK